MFEGYHKQNNLLALKQLTKPLYVPHGALGVGDGETLKPMAIKLEYPTKQNQVVIPVERSIDKVMVDGQSPVITPSDFPKLHYIGHAIGGL